MIFLLQPGDERGKRLPAGNTPPNGGGDIVQGMVHPAFAVEKDKFPFDITPYDMLPDGKAIPYQRELFHDFFRAPRVLIFQLEIYDCLRYIPIVPHTLQRVNYLVV